MTLSVMEFLQFGLPLGPIWIENQSTPAGVMEKAGRRSALPVELDDGPISEIARLAFNFGGKLFIYRDADDVRTRIEIRGPNLDQIEAKLPPAWAFKRKGVAGDDFLGTIFVL